MSVISEKIITRIIFKYPGNNEKKYVLYIILEFNMSNRILTLKFTLEEKVWNSRTKIAEYWVTLLSSDNIHFVRIK